MVRTRAGVSVRGFSESAAALQWLGRNSPAMIITDHLMPGPTGLDVARAVRASDTIRAVPILLLTGVSDPALQAEARAARVDRIALKPLRIAELLQHIEELLHPSGIAQRL